MGDVFIIDACEKSHQGKREGRKGNSNMGFKSNTPHDNCTAQKEVRDKSAALDEERIEVACLRQDIIDEYEKKSTELLEYLNSMESVFDQQRLEYEDREGFLKRENDELKHELAYGCRAHISEHVAKEQEEEVKSREVHQALQVLKSETKEQEKIARRAHKKIKELQGAVDDLQLELEKKEDEYKMVKKRDEQIRKRIQDENHELRRKAALGWMLGCLSELYLRLDPEIETAGIMKLVRKVQRELECGNNHVFTTGAMAPKLEYELIQREIRRLINRAEASRNIPLRRGNERITCSAALRSDKRPKEFTGELPGERRRRLCKSKARREQEAAALRLSTPSDLGARCRHLRRVPEGCQQFVLKCTDHKQKPCGYQQCSQIELSKEKCCNLRESDELLKKPLGTWAEVRLINADDPATYQKSYGEIKKILTGLESSMTYLLGQERRRRLKGNHKAPGVVF